MARKFRRSTVAVTAETDAVCGLLSNGFLRLYTSPQPVGPDIPVAAQTLLAELRLNSPAFNAAIDGAATAKSIARVVAKGTGTVAWFRVYRSDGITAVFDGSVGTSNADLTLNRTDIQVGGEVGVSGMTYRAAKQASG